MSSPAHFGSKSAERRDGISLLHQQLKCETAELHLRLEAQLGLLEPELSIHRYQRVLQTFYGFYAPIEVGLVRLTAAAPPLGFPLRARSELIERDLLALGLSWHELAELPRCTDLPRLSCPEDMAGCLYVLEGACLGAQVIAPALYQRLGVAKGSGASFFVGDAEKTSARWILVLTWIDALVRTGARSEDVVASARATFLTLARWVERQGASHRHVSRGERRGRPDGL
jgi:heme oxygenase